MTGFIDLLITIGTFAGALMILVFIHELGHFLAAKAFGMRVDRFSIGFPPRIWGIKVGETDYCIGATPLGGFVKIAGMIDESMDTEHLNNEPEPWEYRSKPVWQRIIVITAGVIFNMILAFFIYFGLTWSNGKTVLPVENSEGIYVSEGSLLEEIGFENGDKVVGVNGERVDYFEDLMNPEVLTVSDLSYIVVRDGQELTIPVATSYLDSIQTRGFLDQGLALPSSISYVQPGSPAAEAGVEDGDRFISADGTPLFFWNELVQTIKASEGAIDFEVLRNGEVIALTITPTKDKTIGIAAPTVEILGAERIRYGFLESVQEGYAQTIGTTTGILQGFARLITGDISFRQNIGGPIAIAAASRQATEAGGWNGFWTFTAFLSITLAIMNILPIPVLDGGHLVFLIYEGVVRRKPSEKVLMIAQNVGFALMICLFVFVIFNDAIKYISF
ncbi:MAG: RIP metalloprotease RseP [Bacteroidota bacterium]